MILTYFFHQTLNRCFSNIMSKEKNHKIWPLKVYSNLKVKAVNEGMNYTEKLVNRTIIAVRSNERKAWKT